MKPYRIVLVFLLILAMLLSSGCIGKTGEDSDPLTSQPSGESLAESSSAPEPDPSSLQEPEPSPDLWTAVYLGVDAQDEQQAALRFFLSGEEVTYTLEAAETAPKLMEGGIYSITVLEGVLQEISLVSELDPYAAGTGDVSYWSIRVTSSGIVVSQAEEPEAGTPVVTAATDSRTDIYLPLPHADLEPLLFGETGIRTRDNLLRTAFAMVGAVLYVPDGMAEGDYVPVPSEWVDFFSWQDDSYSYEDWTGSGLTMYSWCGTDSFGYITYTLESTLSLSQPLPRDYSLFSSLEDMELGFSMPLVISGPAQEETSADEEPDPEDYEFLSLLPGDLILAGEEVWLALGSCPDGSIPVLRCAPTYSRSDALGGGVQLSAVGTSTDCLAYRLAKQVTENAYPQWDERYDVVLLDPASALTASCFIWTDLADPEGLITLSPRQVITRLFGEFPAESEETASTQVTVDPSWFDDALFIGDSITEALRMYAQSTLDLGNAKFLSSSSLSAVNALWSVSNESVHPKIGDTKVRLEDGVAMLQPKYVYIMLGMNSISFGIERSLNDLETLVSLIKAQSPDVHILMESVTPMTYRSDIRNDYLNNYRIAEYNAQLQERCEQNGWYFIDVASVMTDEAGDLIWEYCSDPYNMGIHMTNAGVRTWIEYLLTHVPEDLT